MDKPSLLDHILDRVEARKREVTFDLDGYTPEQVERLTAAVRARGLHVSGTDRWLLVRNL